MFSFVHGKLLKAVLPPEFANLCYKVENKATCDAQDNRKK